MWGLQERQKQTSAGPQQLANHRPRVAPPSTARRGTELPRRSLPGFIPPNSLGLGGHSLPGQLQAAFSSKVWPRRHRGCWEGLSPRPRSGRGCGEGEGLAGLLGAHPSPFQWLIQHPLIHPACTPPSKRGREAFLPASLPPPASRRVRLSLGSCHLASFLRTTHAGPLQAQPRSWHPPYCPPVAFSLTLIEGHTAVPRRCPAGRVLPAGARSRCVTCLLGDLTESRNWEGRGHSQAAGEAQASAPLRRPCPDQTRAQGPGATRESPKPGSRGPPLMEP